VSYYLLENLKQKDSNSKQSTMKHSALYLRSQIICDDLLLLQLTKAS
jgi:hypothetical protein